MIRILTWIGAAFILAALFTFCWSIFRTQGVDEFIAAITVAAVGLGVPGVVALVLAGILGTLQGDESPAAAVEAADGTERHDAPDRGERRVSRSGVLDADLGHRAPENAVAASDRGLPLRRARCVCGPSCAPHTRPHAR
jgi:hypothetical protein